MRNDAVDAYSRNNKLKEKKNSLLAILKSTAHCRIDAAISSYKTLLFLLSCFFSSLCPRNVQKVTKTDGNTYHERKYVPNCPPNLQKTVISWWTLDEGFTFMCDSFLLFSYSFYVWFPKKKFSNGGCCLWPETPLLMCTPLWRIIVSEISKINLLLCLLLVVESNESQFTETQVPGACFVFN